MDSKDGSLCSDTSSPRNKLIVNAWHWKDKSTMKYKFVPDSMHPKGMLYTASVLSGDNDNYPTCFMIASGNQDPTKWTKMLGLLKKSCQSNAINGAKDVILHPRNQFVVTSNRDKGLNLP